MENEYNIHINGLGDYLVSATVNRVLNSKTVLECEIDVVSVKKFDDMLEAYDAHDPSEKELVLIERQIAEKFFNSLH